MGPNPQFPADLVTFTEEIYYGKLYFLSSSSGLSPGARIPFISIGNLTQPTLCYEMGMSSLIMREIELIDSNGSKFTKESGS